MKRISKTIAIMAMALMLSLASFNFALAQSFSSALSSIESVIGPIIPPNGFASTFRSEVGTALSVLTLRKAILTVPGQQPVELDLLSQSYLDVYPLRFDTYAKFRFWRFGFRTQYSYFEDRRRKYPDEGKFSFTGLFLGGDFDVVQLQWLSLGANIDFYLMNPEFFGDNLPPNFSQYNVNVSGEKPITLGGYFRYIPPEIWNIPVHVEAFYKTAVKGSKLTSYGGSLVFRPQIYRFDVAAKFSIEKILLKFQNDGSNLSGQAIPGDFKLDTDWLLCGGELAIYF